MNAATRQGPERRVLGRLEGGALVLVWVLFVASIGLYLFFFMFAVSERNDFGYLPMELVGESRWLAQRERHLRRWADGVRRGHTILFPGTLLLAGMVIWLTKRRRRALASGPVGTQSFSRTGLALGAIGAALFAASWPWDYYFTEGLVFGVVVWAGATIVATSLVRLFGSRPPDTNDVDGQCPGPPLRSL